MRVQTHGGGCCGVRHISGFGGPGMWPPNQQPITQADLDLQLEHYELRQGPKQRGKLIEAVITDNQFKHQPNLAQLMKDNGFELVNRFHNNTGGMCNVLHRVSGKRDIVRASARLPFLQILIGE